MRHIAIFLAAFAIAACRTGSPPASDATPMNPTWTASADLVEPVPRTSRPSRERQSGACATLRDAEAADLLKVARGDDGLVLYANEQVGLMVVDVAQPDDPTLLATSSFTGTPFAVFERDGAAIVVYAPKDRPESTVIRAISIERRSVGRPLGEVALPGAVRDVWRVDDAIVVSREVSPFPRAGVPATAITALTLDQDGLRQRDELLLAGGGAVTGASPWGLAVARPLGDELGIERTSVTWIGASGAGALQLGGTATFSGVVPRWRRASDHTIDVTEDDQVRIVACATATCAFGEPAAYAAIDFSDPERPRLTAWSLLARAGGGVFAFTGDRLFVARPSEDGGEATDLTVFRTERDLVPSGALRLPGTVASLIVRDHDAIALGWSGGAWETRRALVHHVDVRHRPKRLGSVSFGGDWTWSPAFDDDRAISFDPNATVAALPMTTLRERNGAVTAVQVLSFTPSGPRPLIEREVAAAERVLFVEGRLLAFSGDGVLLVTAPGEQAPRRSWAELGGLNR